MRVDTNRVFSSLFFAKYIIHRDECINLLSFPTNFISNKLQMEMVSDITFYKIFLWLNYTAI